MNRRVFQITEDVFKAEPLFVTDCTYRQMQTYLNRRFNLNIAEPESELINGTMLTFCKAPWRVVWVRHSKATSVLIHEIFHLVSRVCQDKGVPIVAHHPNGECGDETAAYLLEFYFVEAMKRIRAA